MCRIITNKTVVLDRTIFSSVRINRTFPTFNSFVHLCLVQRGRSDLFRLPRIHGQRNNRWSIRHRRSTNKGPDRRYGPVPCGAEQLAEEQSEHGRVFAAPAAQRHLAEYSSSSVYSELLPQVLADSADPLALETETAADPAQSADLERNLAEVAGRVDAETAAVVASNAHTASAVEAGMPEGPAAKMEVGAVVSLPYLAERRSSRRGR